jgi:WD40 repeat protein
MPETKRPLKVFLCHASADKPKVKELYRYLRRRGIQPWLDAEDLVGGQDWREEIPKAIKASEAIIICLSKNSINKEGYVQAEITFALEKALEIPAGRIFIIPARFEDCEVPQSLDRYQWVDLFEEDGFPKLMKSLRMRARQLERATVQVPESDESSPNLTSVAETEHNAIAKAAREKEEREATERAEREKTEKAAREQLEREAAEKIRREEAERKAAEKAMLEKAKRDAVEKAKRERAERQTAQIAALKETFSKSFNSLKLVFLKAKPFLEIGGIIGIIFILFWVASLVIPQISPPMPTANASMTPRLVTTVASSITPISFTKTIEPYATPTQTRTLSTTPIRTEKPTATFRPHSINWEGTQIPWPAQPISVDNAKELKEIANIQSDPGSFDMVFSHDDKSFIFSSGAVIHIRNTDDNTVRSLYHPHDVWCLSLSPDKNLLASVNGLRELRIWNINDGVLLKKYRAPYTYSYISCPIAFSPDGSSLALVESQGITYRHASDLTLIRTITDPNNPNDSFNLTVPTFSPDGTLLAAKNQSGSIYLWSTEDWTLKATIQDAGSNYAPVVFSPDGNLLASSKYGTVLIWGVSDGRLIQTLKDTSSSNWFREPIFFLPNSQILVTGFDQEPYDYRQGGFRLWRVADGKSIQTVELNEHIVNGTISNDGTTLLITTVREVSPYPDFIHIFGVKP